MRAIYRTFFIALLMLWQTETLAANLISNTNEKADSTQLVITGDAAYKWVGEHLDSLANSYLNKSGNILDPDNIREELKCIGYNGLNVTDYIMASRQIDSLVLARLIDRAEAEGNKTIFFMMGSTASGKSTALRNNPQLKELVNSAGLVYDGAFISIPSFESRLKMVQDRGFKASIVFVHNDPVTGFTNLTLSAGGGTAGSTRATSTTGCTRTPGVIGTNTASGTALISTLINNPNACTAAQASSTAAARTGTGRVNDNWPDDTSRGQSGDFTWRNGTNTMTGVSGKPGYVRIRKL